METLSWAIWKLTSFCTLLLLYSNREKNKTNKLNINDIEIPIGVWNCLTKHMETLPQLHHQLQASSSTVVNINTSISTQNYIHATGHWTKTWLQAYVTNTNTAVPVVPLCLIVLLCDKITGTNFKMSLAWKINTIIYL